MWSEYDDEFEDLFKFTDEDIVEMLHEGQKNNAWLEAHRKWIEKKHNNNLTPKETYVKNAAEAFRYQELIDWASYQVNIEPSIEYMEDYYSISAELFTSDPDFIQTFGSMYRYVKTLFPDYEWIKSYFIDEF